ncbi:hypothetical protein ACF0H5_019591 [Mactra antiquata]
MTAELELLKDIPGYRAILKSVLKAQIQMLMDQLSTHTGEESIVLTASVHDGSLYHLGSEAGKGFLEGKDELKAEFLGFCLKCEHKKEKQDKESLQYGQSHNLLPPSKRQRPRIRPGPYSLSPPSSSSSMRSPPFSQNSTVSSLNQNVTIQHDANDNTGSFMESNESEHVTTAANGNSSQQSNIDDDNDDRPIVKIERDDVRPIVKIERDDVDDENSLPADENWEHNGESEQSQEDPGSSQQGGSHLGGIAFPGLDNAHHDFSSKPLPEISTNDLKQALYPQGNSLNNTSLSNDYFSPQQRKSQFWCRVCNKVLQNRNLFEYHINAHAGVRPFECEICKRKFGSKQVLQTHQRLHSGERPFVCNISNCDRSFTARSGLVYHQRKHHKR